MVSAAVAETKGRVPVIAGCGYGTAMAIELARDAEKRGADGLLLLPPYLVNSEQAGLAAHIEKVCKAVSIGVIVYNRDNAIVNDETLARLCERNANLVGFKDGVGDLELLARVYSRLGKRVTYIGGMPTAETYALPYRDIGFDTYSSAIFNFMPVWAKRFYRRRARRRSRHGAKSPARFRDALYRDPQSCEGLCGVDRQGGNEHRRPAGGPRAFAADGSEARGSRGAAQAHRARPEDQLIPTQTSPGKGQSRIRCIALHREREARAAAGRQLHDRTNGRSRRDACPVVRRRDHVFAIGATLNGDHAFATRD